MKRKQAGFTLIELVMVIVILGVLAAVAMPKFVDLKGDAEIAAKKGISGAVKSTFSVLVAKNAAAGATVIYPTVAELAAGLDPKGTVPTGGDGVISNGYTVPTYKADTCLATSITTASTDVVRCVGDAL